MPLYRYSHTEAPGVSVQNLPKESPIRCKERAWRSKKKKYFSRTKKYKDIDKLFYNRIGRHRSWYTKCRNGSLETEIWIVLNLIWMYCSWPWRLTYRQNKLPSYCLIWDIFLSLQVSCEECFVFYLWRVDYTNQNYCLVRALDLTVSLVLFKDACRYWCDFYVLELN